MRSAVFLPMPGILRQRDDVAGCTSRAKSIGGHAGQHRQRDLRADAADFLQVAEQRALGFAQEAVQRDAVFLHRVMREAGSLRCPVSGRS